MTVWGLVVIKDFGRAKTRLSACLVPAQRAALARRLSLHVMDANLACEALDGLLVATDSADVQFLAEARDASVQLDPEGASISGIIDAALERLAREGVTTAVVFMADLPLLRPEDVEEVVRRCGETDVVLVPDTSGMGTNAIGLHLPARLKSSFGHSDSLARHIESAVAAGLRHEVLEISGVAFDLDTPEDLETFEGVIRQAR